MESSIVKFFDGARVLVTGGTGFMGKVLLEKLLRTCLGIERIYILVRVKKGKQPAARLVELFDDPLFTELKSKVPDYANKVTCVPGDCSLQGLGMSDGDRALLTSTVTHIFHGAATVRFADPLRLAININVVGVREMLIFCRACPKLEVVTHTSTAYAHVSKEILEEKLYEIPIGGDAAIQLVDCFNDEKLNSLTEGLISPWNNTYSFTKAIGEDIVKKYGHGLPICVFRPSIVCSTAEAPVKGWSDNLNGPMGVFAGAARGVFRVMCVGSVDADLVPVDKAVNGLICAAWQTARRHRALPSTETADIAVYNFVAPKDNRITWVQLGARAQKSSIKMPSNNSVWYYYLKLTSFWPLFRIYSFLFHIIPGIVVDAALFLTGSKPRMLKAHENVKKFVASVRTFSTRQWNFVNKNMGVLLLEMSHTDRKLFNFDFSQMDWDEYVENMIKGNRVYILKEHPSTIPAALRRQMKLKIAHHLVQVIIYSSLFYVFYTVLMPLCPGFPIQL